MGPTCLSELWTPRSPESFHYELRAVIPVYTAVMPKAPSPLTSPRIKKLAARAPAAPSMLSTAETRELGASVMAHIEPRVESGKLGPAKPTKVAVGRK